MSWYFANRARSDSPGIVLGGALRSGTTLARVILDSHPQIACGPESQLFCGRFEEYSLSRKFEMSRSAIRRLEQTSPSFPEFVTRFLVAHAERDQAEFWAEKTPGNVYHVGWILERFPNVTFVHIVRDGRAVVNSIRTWPRHRLVAGKLVPNEVQRDVDDCIQKWLSPVEAGLNFSGHPRVLEVRYEDFVRDPEAAFTPILERLGLDWHPEMAHPHEARSSSRDPRKFPSNIEATQPIDPSTATRWASELSPDEIRRIEERGAHIQERFGYPPDRVLTA
jgi:protein-tyrosine sulfotransferase